MHEKTKSERLQELREEAEKERLNDPVEQINEAVNDIKKNHQQIIDDWCKAYLAQLNEEGHEIKPGLLTLNKQSVLLNGKMAWKYWFTIEEHE